MCLGAGIMAVRLNLIHVWDYAKTVMMDGQGNGHKKLVTYYLSSQVTRLRERDYLDIAVNLGKKLVEMRGK
jgi:hypothetical protein